MRSLTSLTCGAALGLALLATQTGCGTAAKDQAGNQLPELSTVTLANLASPAASWPTSSTLSSAGSPSNTWTMTAGASGTYLRATFAETGGSAMLTPGNLALTSGLPVNLAPAATTTYTVTVTDGAGHSAAPLSATLVVVPAPTATITAPAAVAANAAGLTASVPSDPASNGAGSSYLWAASNATITAGGNTPAVTFTAGSANADGSASNMTLTCTVTNTANVAANAVGTVTLPVDAPAPLTLTYSNPSPTYYQGVSISNNLPTVLGTVQGYSVNPALPAGLTLDPVLGVISGTPTVLSPLANYTVTASNSGGSASAVLALQVVAQPAVVFAANPAKIGPGGTSILSWTTSAVVASISITATPADPTLGSSFVVPTGTRNVSPTQTTLYSLTANLVGGGSLAPVTQTVTLDSTPLAFSSFTATPTQVAFGGSSTLAWTLAGTPDTLTLNSPATETPASMLGDTSFVQLVKRRQNYSLQASNSASSATSPVLQVLAPGLDTLAGNVSAGAGSLDGTGSAAQFNNPCNIAVDPQGNIYVPDYYNQTIRVVTPAGVVSTLAGITGVPGVTDGVPGLQAQFNGPRAVAYWQDPSNGNAPYLFVAEYGNSCIRKITLSASNPPTATNVAVFAGTIGTYGNGATQLDDPEGLAIYNNALYILEYYSGDVRVISSLSGATGTLSNYAGTPGGTIGYLDGTVGVGGFALTQAEFEKPNAMAVDASGNLYVSELNGNRIRKISPTAVSTLAGDNTPADKLGTAGFVDGGLGTSRLNAPSGVAVVGSTLYISDSKNNALRALNLSSNVLSTVVGAAAPTSVYGSRNGNGNNALLGNPQGLAYDSVHGLLYIAEGGNDDLRACDPSYNVTTLAGAATVVGSADSTSSAPQGSLAINPSLNGNATSPTTYSMAGVVMDAQSNLYVADSYNHTIRMITPAGWMTTIAGTPGTPGHSDGTGSGASFNQPSGLAMDAAGNLYIADMMNSAIRMLTRNASTGEWSSTTLAGIPGTNSLVNGTGSVTTFKYPFGVCVSANGQTIYVSDTGNAKIRMLTNNAGTWTSSTLATTVYTPHFPMGIAVDGSGNIYVAERYNYCVAMLAAPVSGSSVGTIIGGVSGSHGFNNGPVTASATTSSLFDNPEGLCVDGNGNVYVADIANQVVQKIALVSGVWTTSTVVGQGVNTIAPLPTKAVPQGTSLGSFPATLNAPQAVAVSPAGHDLYITTNGGVAQATSIDGQ